ncbi:hypothetical protein ACHHYP_07012 [Achlya hypogyna]|uniref:Uncharacterized protein n=1 Tax=Achlya hypogyna TaxID=1202772 RepID=A0A1V9YR60_ACHHY|nr:hypothetical protein ACHHYP_07012 [Achlya hypogyna]
MNFFKHCWRRMVRHPDDLVAKSALTPLTQTAFRRGQLSRQSSQELTDLEFWRIIGLPGAPPSPPTMATNAPRRSSVADFVYQTSVVLAYQDLPTIFKPRIQATLPPKLLAAEAPAEVELSRPTLA